MKNEKWDEYKNLMKEGKIEKAQEKLKTFEKIFQK